MDERLAFLREKSAFFTSEVICGYWQIELYKTEVYKRAFAKRRERYR